MKVKKKWLLILLAIAIGWGAVSTGLLVKQNQNTEPPADTETAAVAVTDMVI